MGLGGDFFLYHPHTCCLITVHEARELRANPRANPNQRFAEGEQELLTTQGYEEPPHDVIPYGDEGQWFDGADAPEDTGSIGPSSFGKLPAPTDGGSGSKDQGSGSGASPTLGVAASKAIGPSAVKPATSGPLANVSSEATISDPVLRSSGPPAIGLKRGIAGRSPDGNEAAVAGKHLRPSSGGEEKAVVEGPVAGSSIEVPKNQEVSVDKPVIGADEAAKAVEGSGKRLPLETVEEGSTKTPVIGNVDSASTRLPLATPAISRVAAQASTSGMSTQPPSSAVPAKEIYSLLSDEEDEIIPIRPPASMTVASTKREPKEEDCLPSADQEEASFLSLRNFLLSSGASADELGDTLEALQAFMRKSLQKKD